MNMEENGRFPIIPLDYKDRNIAHKKELLIDYDTGRLYVVSADNKSVVFDVTEQILNVVGSEVKGDNIAINIESLGKVNLKKFILDLKNNSLHTTPLKGKGGVGTFAYDFRSISNKDNIVQMHNFWNAKPGQVPTVDGNGVLVWSELGSFYSVIHVEEDPTGVYVLSNRYNESTIDSNVVFKLEAEQPYAIISWKVVSGETAPNIELAPGFEIVKEYESDLNMPANSTFIFEFETFDHGQTWYEKVKKYIPGNDIVSTEYLEEHVYSKEEVDKKLTWKNAQMESIGD